MAQQNKVERVFIHCFLDGRDTPPHSGIDYLRQLQQKMRELGVGKIASLTGRYYAMDRDNRWERIERAYRAVVHGEAETKARPIRSRRCARATSRASRTSSSMPVVITTGASAAAAACRPDSRRGCRDLLQFPRRPRAPDDPGHRRAGLRQIHRPGAAEESCLRGHDAVRQNLAVAAILVRRRKNSSTFWRKCSRSSNLAICACAETEKYAHVTYFFNGGVEKPFARRGAHPGALAQSAHL